MPEDEEENIFISSCVSTACRLSLSLSARHTSLSPSVSWSLTSDRPLQSHARPDSTWAMSVAVSVEVHPDGGVAMLVESATQTADKQTGRKTAAGVVRTATVSNANAVQTSR